MTHGALTTSEWDGTVERLGGVTALEAEARATGAFVRPRAVKCGVDLLRLTFAYCLGHKGLRTTAAWSDGIGLASLSDVALLGRLRNMLPWLEKIVARLLAGLARAARHAGGGADAVTGRGRRIRLLDATTVRKAGKSARENGRLWRIHASFVLPAEQFCSFELTDEKEPERINRSAVTPGEILLADRVHCRADDLADVIAQGADVVVRASWRSARWLVENGGGLDIIRELINSSSGTIDRPIWLARSKAAPLRLRLIAVKMPKDKAAQAVLDARAEAKRKQHAIQPGTLIAAEWVIMVTSLAPADYATEKVLELYRLRWRIEVAFKRMKSLAGLKGPPGECPLVAKAWVLCHLIVVLLTEAHLTALGDSPHWAPARDETYGVHTAC